VPARCACLSSVCNSHPYTRTSVASHDFSLRCFHCQLRGRRVFPTAHVWILRVGHSYIRDHVWRFPTIRSAEEEDGFKANARHVAIFEQILPWDVYLYGEKGSLKRWFSETVTFPVCPSASTVSLSSSASSTPSSDVVSTPWSPPLQPGLLIPRVSDALSYALSSMRATQRTIRNGRPQLDIDTCFPRCPPDFTPEQEEGHVQFFCSSYDLESEDAIEGQG
jgi:hypothetical protein